MLIVYGAQAGMSVVKLYAAALLPGFLLAGMYIVYVIALGDGQAAASRRRCRRSRATCRSARCSRCC